MNFFVTSNNMFLLVIKLLKEVLFPTLALFLFFSLIDRKKFTNTPALKFIIVALLIFLLLPILFSGLHFHSESRYFYSAIICAIVLAVPGAYTLSECLERWTCYKISKKTIFISFFVLTSFACITKALMPQEKKTYIVESIKIAEQYKTKHKIIILSNFSIPHIAYYTNAKYYQLDAIINKDKPQLIKDALQYLQQDGTKVFIIINMPDKDYQKTFENKGITFPLKLIKEFKEKHNAFYSLYEYTP